MELKEYLDELNKLNEAKDETKRHIESGINWDWYFAPTKEEAIKYFKELTGSNLYDSTIIKDNNEYAFRLKKGFKKKVIDEDMDEGEKENISFTEYDDDLEYAYSEWAVVKSKTVEDEDGEKTKLVWYYRTGDPLHIFMLGDPETTEPDEDEAEYQTKSVVKAREYFDSYGKYIEESLSESMDNIEKEYTITLKVQCEIEGNLVIKSSHVYGFFYKNYGEESFEDWDEDSIDYDIKSLIADEYLFSTIKNNIEKDIDYINKKLDIIIDDMDIDGDYEDLDVIIYVHANKIPNKEKCISVFEKYTDIDIQNEELSSDYYDEDEYESASFSLNSSLKNIEIRED